MKNQLSFFKLLLILVLVAPALYYFVGGKSEDYGKLRDVLVVLQLVVGLGLLLFYSLKKNKAS